MVLLCPWPALNVVLERPRKHPDPFELLSSASSMQYIRCGSQTITGLKGQEVCRNRFTLTQKGPGNDVLRLHNEVLEVN